MWHKIGPPRGAAKPAPLLISGVRLRSHWQGHLIEEANLVAKLDTAASISVIPLHIAHKMRLASRGVHENLKSFDEGIQLDPYPLFRVEMFIPKYGWTILDVIGCKRDNILLGRDICNHMLLIADWRNCWFGMRSGMWFHDAFRVLFCRLLKQVKP